MIGYDRRADEAKGTPSRSDTLMLVRADPDEKTISMLSFPRDLQVEIAARARRPFIDKINAAYATCGPSGTLETVGELTGVPINYIITVNFRGFRQLVDKLGGVWMDVDRRYFNDHGGPTRATRRSTSSRATSGSTARGRSTSSASGTPTPTSTATRASSSSSARSRTRSSRASP